MLGVSWRTDLAGWIGIAAGIVGMIADIIVTQGMPKTIPEYFLFGGLVLAGIQGVLAKDGKVSNSKDPGSPKDVPAGL